MKISLLKHISLLRELRKKFKEMRDEEELPEAWKEVLINPAFLLMATTAAGILMIIKYREDMIASLPPHIQQRMRRCDKRHLAIIKRRKRPILRHARTKVRRSRVL